MQPSFIETICLENGVPQHLSYHQERLEATIRAHYPTIRDIPQLKECVPPSALDGRAKWRIVYSDKIDQMSVSAYQARPIDSLQLVEANDMAYHYKYLDRSSIETCYQAKGESSDILIVRHGLLTDTSIANIALGDGDVWLTPREPILRGTTRARLLDNQQIKIADLTPDDLIRYPSIVLFNALIPFGSLILPTSCIKK